MVENTLEYFLNPPYTMTTISDLFWRPFVFLNNNICHFIQYVCKIYRYQNIVCFSGQKSDPYTTAAALNTGFCPLKWISIWCGIFRETYRWKCDFIQDQYTLRRFTIRYGKGLYTWWWFSIHQSIGLSKNQWFT